MPVKRKQVTFDDTSMKLIVLDEYYAKRQLQDNEHHRCTEHINRMGIIDRYVFRRYMKNLRKKNESLKRMITTGDEQTLCKVIS